MPRMIRRQVYLEPIHQSKLLRMAARWGCTESEVIRAAIDRLPESADPIDTCLTAAGMLVPARPERDLLRGEDFVEELEQTLDARSAARSSALGLADAVVEDRR